MVASKAEEIGRLNQELAELQSRAAIELGKASTSRQASLHEAAAVHLGEEIALKLRQLRDLEQSA